MQPEYRIGLRMPTEINGCSPEPGMEDRTMMWIIMIGIITILGGLGLWLTRKQS